MSKRGSDEQISKENPFGSSNTMDDKPKQATAAQMAGRRIASAKSRHRPAGLTNNTFSQTTSFGNIFGSTPAQSNGTSPQQPSGMLNSLAGTPPFSSSSQSFPQSSQAPLLGSSTSSSFPPSQNSGVSFSSSTTPSSGLFGGSFNPPSAGFTFGASAGSGSSFKNPFSQNSFSMSEQSNPFARSNEPENKSPFAFNGSSNNPFQRSDTSTTNIPRTKTPPAVDYASSGEQSRFQQKPYEPTSPTDTAMQVSPAQTPEKPSTQREINKATLKFPQFKSTNTNTFGEPATLDNSSNASVTKTPLSQQDMRGPTTPSEQNASQSLAQTYEGQTGLKNNFSRTVFGTPAPVFGSSRHKPSSLADGSPVNPKDNPSNKGISSVDATAGHDIRQNGLATDPQVSSSSQSLLFPKALDQNMTASVQRESYRQAPSVDKVPSASGFQHPASHETSGQNVGSFATQTSQPPVWKTPSRRNPMQLVEALEMKHNVKLPAHFTPLQRRIFWRQIKIRSLNQFMKKHLLAEPEENVDKLFAFYLLQLKTLDKIPIRLVPDDSSNSTSTSQTTNSHETTHDIGNVATKDRQPENTLSPSLTSSRSHTSNLFMNIVADDDHTNDSSTAGSKPMKAQNTAGAEPDSGHSGDETLLEVASMPSLTMSSSASWQHGRSGNSLFNQTSRDEQPTKPPAINSTSSTDPQPGMKRTLDFEDAANTRTNKSSKSNAFASPADSSKSSANAVSESNSRETRNSKTSSDQIFSKSQNNTGSLFDRITPPGTIQSTSKSSIGLGATDNTDRTWKEGDAINFKNVDSIDRNPSGPNGEDEANKPMPASTRPSNEQNSNQNATAGLNAAASSNIFGMANFAQSQHAKNSSNPFLGLSSKSVSFGAAPNSLRLQKGTSDEPPTSNSDKDNVEAEDEPGDSNDGQTKGTDHGLVDDSDNVISEIEQARLLQFSEQHEGKSPWVGKGRGTLRLLARKDNNKARLVFRADGSGRVLLNAPLHKELTYEVTKAKPSLVTFASVEQKDGKQQITRWMLRLASENMARDFAANCEKWKVSHG